MASNIVIDKTVQPIVILSKKKPAYKYFRTICDPKSDSVTELKHKIAVYVNMCLVVFVFNT